MHIFMSQKSYQSSFFVHHILKQILHYTDYVPPTYIIAFFAKWGPCPPPPIWNWGKGAQAPLPPQYLCQWYIMYYDMKCTKKDHALVKWIYLLWYINTTSFSEFYNIFLHIVWNEHWHYIWKYWESSNFEVTVRKRRPIIQQQT